MRPAPGPIPDTLPDILKTSVEIQRIIDRPDTRLGDASIGALVRKFGRNSPAWLTGSNVWLPAIFEQQSDSDYDIVFYDPTSAGHFVVGVLGELNRRAPAGAGAYTMGSTGFGSSRIVHPGGKGIIDVWCLGNNESIGELLMGFPHAHQRCAFYLSENPSPGCLFRLVRPKFFGVGLFDRIASSSSTNYPGKIRSEKSPEPMIVKQEDKNTKLKKGLWTKLIRS